MQKQKGSLQTIFIKTLLAVLLFAGIGTIIVGGGYIIGEYSKNAENNQIIKPVNQEENYYDVLEKKCDNDSCCLSSLKTMRANNYKRAEKNGNCPEGFFMNGLKCKTSYQWCEPMEDVGIGIDQKFYCEEYNDCLATCIEPGCYNKDYFKNQKDCEALILHSCECVNNKCQRLEKKSGTSDWQIYRNEEFGFEFEYPSDFKIRNENSETVDFILDVSRIEFCGDNPECTIPSLSARVIKEKSVDEYIQKINQKDTRGNNTIIITKTNTVNNQRAKWGYKPSMIDYMFVAIESPQNFILKFSLSGPGLLHFEHSLENKKNPELIFDAYYFDQILSSFKFIEN